ncbi:MAG: dihydrofolate synthase/folylpolyglutamate synthase [Lentisphaeria bacterium]|jgi:dihydrofolate synthase/folylpolyglutamate synthase
MNSWLTWMETLHPSEIELGLGRIREVAVRLGMLKPDARVITVAGTNGKGSCIAVLNAFLRQAGCNVGVYTSPHLSVYNERIKINDDLVGDQQLCDAFHVIDLARGEISLTYFEFGTLAALYLFSLTALDYWLLEVGLGGRLDAVNIIDHNVSVITSIELDHEQWLGHTRDDIASEKAGILREQGVFVCGESNPPPTMLARADELHIQPVRFGKAFGYEEHFIDGVRHYSFSLTCRGRTQVLNVPFELVHLPIQSVCTALQVLALEDCMPEVTKVKSVLSSLFFAGRFEKIHRNDIEIFLDVAHNPAAVELLVKQLDDYLRYTGCSNVCLSVVVAMMADKNITGSLAPFASRVKHWFVTSFGEFSRSASVPQLTQALSDNGVVFENITGCIDVDEALASAIAYAVRQEASQTKSVLVVTGSFVTVAKARDFLGLS